MRLPRSVTPRAYALDLTIDPRKPRFSGRVTIAVHLDEPTTRLVLHGRDLTVARAVVERAGRAIHADVASRRAFGQKQGEDELVLTLAEALPAGDASLVLDYDAPFGALWGLYRTEAEGRAYAFTQLESIEARRMFPCFDEPGFKTPFDVTLHVPSDMSAVSNARVARREVEGDLVRYVFERTAPLPTYLVAVAVGDLDVLDGPTSPVPVRLVATRGRAKLGADSTKVAAKTLAALEAYFARPYPYGKLDIVAIPEFPVGAMENAGLVTFRDELLLTDAAAPASAVRRQRYVVAHELAHQWFGDLVTMSWWDDLWLNEGFATWMQAKACDAAFPGFGAVDERVLDKTSALAADLLPSARAVRPKIDLTDRIYEAGGWSAYQKGASVLAMIEAWSGPEAFQRGIQDYLAKHANGSVSSPDLFRALDAATGRPVSRVAASFLDQPGVPFVDVRVTCGGEAKKGARVVLTERELGLDGPKDTPRWSVPVCLSVDGAAAPACSLLEPTSASAVVDLPACPKALHPNAGEAGYYRYGLDATWLDKAAKSATSSAKERAGLVANTWALVETGALPASEVLRVLSLLDLGRDRSRVLLATVIDVLSEMDRQLVDDASRPSFVRFVHRLLDGPAARVGLPKKSGETDDERLTRVLVLGGLFDLTDDPKVAAELEPFAKRYLDDPASVDADLGVLALRVSARAGGEAGRSLTGARLVAAKTPAERVALTVALVSRKDPKELERALDLFLTGEIRASDIRHLKNGALRRVDTLATFYTWMRGHFDPIVTKLDGGGASLVSTLGKACDEPTVAALSAFLARELDHLEGAQRAYDEGLAEAHRCIKVRAREAKGFAAALSAKP